jgi:hypothetical protein
VAGEAISLDAALAAFITAQEGLVSVAVHGMGFTLVAEQAGCGGELEFLASTDLALVGLQVGIHEFTGAENVVSFATYVWGEGVYNRTRNCTSASRACVGSWNWGPSPMGSGTVHRLGV